MAIALLAATGGAWALGAGPFARATPTPIAANAATPEETRAPEPTATPVVTATPGEVFAVVATKTPRPVKAPVRRGTVTVTAKPWVAVWIDGKSVDDETPLQRHELAAGKHEFRFVHRKKVVTRVVDIAPDRETKLFVDVEAGTVGAPPR